MSGLDASFGRAVASDDAVTRGHDVAIAISIVGPIPDNSVPRNWSHLDDLGRN